MDKFSIIIPAYNEYETLLVNIPKLVHRFPEAEILLIENGSDIAPDFCYDNVRIEHSRKKGLGIALKWGLIRAKHNIAVFLPADLSYDLSFCDTAPYLISKGWHLVIGSKGVSDWWDIDRPAYRQAVSYAYNFFYDGIYNLRVKDITGVKAYARDWIIPLLPYCPSDGIFFEVQVIRQMRKRKMRILEIPVIVKDFNRSAFVRPLRGC